MAGTATLLGSQDPWIFFQLPPMQPSHPAYIQGHITLQTGHCAIYAGKNLLCNSVDQVDQVSNAVNLLWPTDFLLQIEQPTICMVSPFSPSSNSIYTCTSDSIQNVIAQTVTKSIGTLVFIRTSVTIIEKKHVIKSTHLSYVGSNSVKYLGQYYTH